MSNIGTLLASPTAHKVFAWLFIAALLVVSVLAVLPAENVPSTLISWDKAQHAIAFAVLAGMGLLARRWPATYILIGLLAFGVLMEVTQGILPWREGSFWDWVADAIGIAFAWFVTRRLIPP